MTNQQLSPHLMLQDGQAEEAKQFYVELSEDGFAMRPKNACGFGPFGWITGRYGVSWQLSVAPEPTAS